MGTSLNLKSDACEPSLDLFSLDVVSFSTPEHIFLDPNEGMRSVAHSQLRDVS